VNGSRFALDRERLAALLGFSAPITHTRDANWQTDGLADLASHAAIAAVGASRFAEDVELYGSDEFALLRIGDELCRASALMPQKRNPYALVVLRGGAGTLIGRATGVLATQRTPSGRTDNLLYAYSEVAGAVELAARLLRLAAAVAESLTFDAARARALLRAGGAMATDAAELMSLERGVDYRSAYRAVGEAVAAGTFDASALDPAEAMATRTVTGGAAVAPMEAMLGEMRAALATSRARLGATRAAIAGAEEALIAGTAAG
jgi:argininosuccinate lyase